MSWPIPVFLVSKIENEKEENICPSKLNRLQLPTQ